MKFLLPAIAASVMLLVISCNRNTESSTSEPKASLEAIQVQDMPAADENKKEEKRKGTNQSPGKNTNADWDKKIIKTAVMNVETQQFKTYSRQIHELLTKWESYIAREEENESDGKLNNSLSIKVPASRFDEAVNSISSLNGKVLVKQISSEDVTGELVDVRTRAEAKKTIRLRYLDMLQKAKNIEEIIQVEREINQIQEQIEAAEGRLNYLAHTTSYSTIELTFFQVIDPKSISDPNPGYAKRLLLAMNEGLKWMGDLLIFIATLWPLWLLVMAGLFIIRRMRRPVIVNK
jgi:hypothetical protein